MHRRVQLIEPIYAWAGLSRASAEAVAAGWEANATTRWTHHKDTVKPPLWVFDYVPVERGQYVSKT